MKKYEENAYFGMNIKKKPVHCAFGRQEPDASRTNPCRGSQ